MPRRLIRIIAFALILAAVYFLYIQRQPRRSAPVRNYPGERAPSESPRPSVPGASSQVICETQYFADWQEPSSVTCTPRTSNGYLLPDPRCTPGGVNPSITLDVLRDPNWRTRTVRNCASSEAQKHIAYRWYNIEKPNINSNENQVCELDHLVPLELGGADGLGNIWPQCGPDSVTLNQRYFKQKDHVENYLAEEVKSGRMSLIEAQKGIASDWTRYLNDADLWCGRTGRC